MKQPQPQVFRQTLLEAELDDWASATRGHCHRADVWMARAEAAEAERDRLAVHVDALLSEGHDLNAENRDLLEKWSARGAERDRLAAAANQAISHIHRGEQGKAASVLYAALAERDKGQT